MKQSMRLILSLAFMLSSGAAMAAANNNGQQNAAADAGQPAPGAHENLPPRDIDNSQINNSGSSSNSGSTLSGDGMTSDDVHKNTMCKDGHCPDTNRKVPTGVDSHKINPKTDGTTQ